MRFSLIALIFLTYSVTQAAPYPATSSSILTAPDRGLAFIQKGFNLKTVGTDWVPVSKNSSDSILDTIRFGPAGTTAEEGASLSVRTDKISSAVTLETYAKKFMRDYPNYGFDVLGSKPVTISASQGLIVDMINRSKNKQLRQLILKQNNQVAVLTCMDDREKFNKTLVSCNQIMKSFEWTDHAASKPASAR